MWVLEAVIGKKEKGNKKIRKRKEREEEEEEEGRLITNPNPPDGPSPAALGW